MSSEMEVLSVEEKIPQAPTVLREIGRAHV